MRVLMITSEYPTSDNPVSGVFVARQVRALQQLGVQVQVFAFRGRGNPLRYARAWRDTRPLIRSGAFDVVHAQFGQSALLALPKRLPLVVTFRGSDLHGVVAPNGRYTLQGRVLKTLSRTVARAADAVIVVSNALGRSLPRGDFDVIPSGVDRAQFFPREQAEARRELDWPRAGKRILFAGDPANGVKRYDLARAAVDALPSDLNAELVCANGVPHDRMPLWLAAADVLLLTSRHEGSPNVVKEALAVGLPVVSVDVGDVRLLLERVAGCEIAPDSGVASIAAGLERALRAGKRVDASEVIADFDEMRLAQRLLSVYERVTERSLN